jgi:hypothetical protein
MFFQLVRKHLFIRCTRTVARPIQCALLPDIEEAHQDQNDEQEHLYKSKHLQFTVYDRPGIEKNCLDIKKDENDPHQVEFDAEALAGASRRRDTAFVG